MGTYISSTEQFRLPNICVLSFTAQVVIFTLMDTIYLSLTSLWNLRKSVLIMRSKFVLYDF